MIDQDSDFGARVARHLRDDVVVWMTTVTPSGAPLPMPVWFQWDGDATVVMHSKPGARIRNLAANPRVALHFEGDGQGGDVVVLSGTAQVVDDLPGAAAPGPYVDKYATRMTGIGMTPQSFEEAYSETVRIAIDRVRGH